VGIGAVLSDASDAADGPRSAESGVACFGSADGVGGAASRGPTEGEGGEGIPQWRKKEERKRQRRLERQKRKEGRQGAAGGAPSSPMQASMTRKLLADSDDSELEVCKAAEEQEGSAGAALSTKGSKKRKKDSAKGESERDGGGDDGGGRAGSGGEQGVSGAQLVKESSRRAPFGNESESAQGGEDRESAIAYPFAVTAEADHAETPRRAYEHIAALLARIARALAKEPADLEIYDPYFCAGTMKAHLRAVGFPKVYNKKEDFYEMVRGGKVPQHDVVVTNPPYSLDHIPRILRWLVSNGRPWLLLVPNYVYMKDYYQPALGAAAYKRVAYLTPPCRYTYEAPRRVADGAGKVRKSGDRKTAPYMSFWYIDPHPALGEVGFRVKGLGLTPSFWHTSPSCLLLAHFTLLPFSSFFSLPQWRPAPAPSPPRARAPARAPAPRVSCMTQSHDRRPTRALQQAATGC